MCPPKHNPTKPPCFLTQGASNPAASHTNVSEETPCTWRPWLACTAPGPPQESLVCDETRISLPAKPSLTRTMLGQLCVAPRTSRARPAVTEPGRKPRVSGGTASAAMQCPRPRLLLLTPLCSGTHCSISVSHMSVELVQFMS